MGEKKLEMVNINSFEEFAPKGNKETGSSLDRNCFGGLVGGQFVCNEFKITWEGTK